MQATLPLVTPETLTTAFDSLPKVEQTLLGELPGKVHNIVMR